MAELQVKSIRSLARGLEILKLIQNAGALSLADLHRITGYPKASLLRILKTMMEEGVVWQRIADAAYLASYALQDRASLMNREQELIEIASPIMRDLSNKIMWPSVLAMPRLTYMEVVETNAPKSNFPNIPLGPIGFQINMLRSATGRAYIAYCDDSKRNAILQRLKLSNRKGDRIAQNDAYIRKMIEGVRAQGYAMRDPAFGGDFDESRNVVDDRRDSIAMPIRIGPYVPASVNITWSAQAMNRQKAVENCLSALKEAVENIAVALQKEKLSFTW
ncbi:MAG: helix-turn-helix domain-containing protein [Rhizobiaceae bacterium]|nr:helix-turn-helix domain-containing protein [Rhizobiaceae bacterium]|tara:strand:+ start:33654 stop:34481 length:828 start_codon:yes stop_codon:yes gene_type:complete